MLRVRDVAHRPPLPVRLADAGVRVGGPGCPVLRQRHVRMGGHAAGPSPPVRPGCPGRAGRNGDRTVTFEVSLPAIVNGKAEDLVLRPGDIVFVPESRI